LWHLQLSHWAVNCHPADPASSGTVARREWDGNPPRRRHVLAAAAGRLCRCDVEESAAWLCQCRCQCMGVGRAACECMLCPAL